MTKKDRDDFLEELLATISPEYLESIRDARADYKAGRVKTHDEVFGHWVTGWFIPGKFDRKFGDTMPNDYPEGNTAENDSGWGGKEAEPWKLERFQLYSIGRAIYT
jgi:hypothetical protein